jgi:hypothetical protein
MTKSLICLIPNIASLAAMAVGFARLASADCAGLQNLPLPDTTISLAQSYAQGDAITMTVKAPVDLCRVAGTIMPTSDSKINFEVWMPSNWTGRYVQVGNSGFAGSIVYGAMAAAAANHNATASTDDGTNQPSGQPAGSFAQLHPEKIKDWGFSAVHLTNTKAKAIVSAFYGQAPGFSYFSGCSKGGQESLMEAQRFPDDFDGILGGGRGRQSDSNLLGDDLERAAGGRPVQQWVSPLRQPASNGDFSGSSMCEREIGTHR